MRFADSKAVVLVPIAVFFRVPYREESTKRKLWETSGFPYPHGKQTTVRLNFITTPCFEVPVSLPSGDIHFQETLGESN